MLLGSEISIAKEVSSIGVGAFLIERFGCSLFVNKTNCNIELDGRAEQESIQYLQRQSIPVVDYYFKGSLLEKVSEVKYISFDQECSWPNNFRWKLNAYPCGVWLLR